MPELPDVETFKRYINSTALRKKIKQVEVKVASLVEGSSGKALSKALTGKRMTKTDRHGKYLLARLSSKKWLVLHFGMTGDLHYYKADDEEPDYTALRLDFANGYHLAYTNRRKLGKIALVDDPDELAEKKDLGPDVYSDELDADRFIDIIRRSNGGIKTALMNQSMMAGLGNVYADEVLFQTGFHPGAKVTALSDKNLKQIHRGIRRVLKTTINHGANPKQFPRTYLTGNREKGDNCPKCGGRLKKTTVSGRPTYYCPDHQKK